MYIIEEIGGHGIKEFMNKEVEIRELQKINSKTNDNIVHGFRFGKADSFACKTLNAGT